MNALIIILVIWASLAAAGFWEAYVEGRNCWHNGKHGWKIKIGKYLLTAYHFYLFWIMFPLLIFVLPLAVYGWNLRLFGILLSAYFSGIAIEDFCWFLANPVVKLKEFRTDFTDYYPWIKIDGKKIIPTGYIFGFLIAILSWYFLWR
jgi:hypothetical protein